MEAVVNAICKQENLPAETVTRLGGGQINHVFLVNDKYIVRIGARENTFSRLKLETELLQNIADDIPAPKILVLGQYENYAYQVQAFVAGKPLHHSWLDLSPEQKDHIVCALASYLKVLHQNTFAEFGFYCDGKRDHSWLKFCEHEFYNTLEEAHAPNYCIPMVVLQATENYFERHKHVLHTASPVLVHRDLWPGNILINDGKISAILDFEFAIQAPRDYELLLIEQFCLYPNDFVEENNEIYTTADFADYFQLLKKHYPELFAVRDLRERLNLYHIIYSLKAYIAWRKTQPQATEGHLPIQPLAKVFNFITEHGTRMTR